MPPDSKELFHYATAIWIDVHGKVLSIPDMDDRYLLNCLKMCWRKPGWRDTTKLLKELESRGYKKTNPEYFI